MNLRQIVEQTQIDIGGGVASPTQAVDGNGQLQYSSAPPWVEMPVNGQSFEEVGIIFLPPVGPTEVEILSFTVPNGFRGVIKRYSCNYLGGGFTSGSGDLIWRIRVNDQVVNNYINILTERGSSNSPKELTGGLLLFSGQRVTVNIIHAANPTLSGTSQVSASIEGWVYDASSY